MNSKYIWNIKSKDEQLIKDISDKCNVSLPVATVLVNRNILEVDDIYAFLHPDIDKFHDPYLLWDMEKAVTRIITAKSNNEKIMIYGDYDVDGITSTSILYMYLRENNYDVHYYIPDRLQEGYGVNKQAIDSIHEQGVSLIVTVDTGITAVNEVEHAALLGIDVIVTDHHECQESLPKATAIINPKRPDCTYPFENLAGVGVTFKLIHGLSMQLGDTSKIWKYLDIVAVGTVADIVSLIDENRIITKLAFKTIPTTWNIGLKALQKVSGLKGSEKITSGIIGFRVAPRLNASGRMGDAKRAVELFITDDENKAASIAEELNEANNQRQELEQRIYKEAVQLIEEQNLDQDKILVVASENWHHGVIGIVASRITERYYRPTILLCIEEGHATGSARSVDGFSIFEAIYQSKDLLTKFGGHDMAAGLSLDIVNIESLRRQLNDYAEKIMDDQTLIPKLKADMLLSLDDIDLPLIEEISHLEPFGMGNPEPKFVINGSVKEIRTIGKEKNHLRLSLRSKVGSLNGIGFGMSDYTLNYFMDNHVDVVGSLDINEWNGMKYPQIVLKDMRMNESMMNELDHHLYQFNLLKQKIWNSSEIPPIRIQRQDCELVYRTLLTLDKSSTYTISLFRLVNDSPNYKIKDIIKLLLCLEVFMELELLDYNITQYDLTFNLHKGRKASLNQSKLFQVMQKNFC